MADAMCGPASALKGLAGHLDRDSSRQQDRFVASPHSAAQNFRSSPAGGSSANASFAAFQNGNNGLSGLNDAGLSGASLYAPAPVGPAAFQARSPWQMNSAPAALSQAPQAQHGGQTWINDFQQMNVSEATQLPAQPGVMQHPAPQFNPMFAGQRPMMGGPMYGFSQPVAPMSMQMPVQAPPTQVMQAEDDFDFDAAMSQWMTANSGPEEETAIATALAESLNQAEAEAQLPNDQAILSPEAHLQMPMEELSVPAEEAEVSNAPSHDSGELAAAARQVVQSVSNETNDKFAKSDFFAFMRRLGNEEIVLRGTEFVEAGAVDSHSPPGTTSEPRATEGGKPSMQPTVEDA